MSNASVAKFRKLSFLALIALFGSITLQTASAQESRAVADKPTFDDLDSPQFSGGKQKAFTPKSWLEIETKVKLSMRPEPKSKTCDRMTVKWYVAVKNPERPGTMLLLTRDIEHVNVPLEEDVYCSVYLSPAAIKSLTGVDRFQQEGVQYSPNYLQFEPADGFLGTAGQNNVSSLQTNRIPTHPDGSYHGHISSLAAAQVFGDSEFQALHDGTPYNERYAMFAVGRILNCTFYRDEEVPRVDASGRGNVGNLQVSRPTQASTARLGKEVGCEVINATGVRIVRTIITGGEALMECHIPESQDYVTEAGITGVVRGLEMITPNAAAMSVERVRFIIRAPLDRQQQQVSMTWSWAGDFGVPSDARAMYTGSRYKRCIVIESADNLVG
jgi:hypothetical protein